MKSHRLDVISLVFGLTFLGFSAWSFATDADPSVLGARWIWPAFLLVVGAVLIVTTVGSEVRRTTSSAHVDDDTVVPPSL